MKKEIKYYLIGILALVFLLVIGFVFLRGHLKEKVTPTEEELKPTEYQALKLIKVSEIVNYGTAKSNKPDQSSYLVKDNSFLTLRNSSISKEEGDSSNIELSNSTGLNAAILVTYNCGLKMFNSKLITSADGSHGIYINGQKAKAEIDDTTIETYNQHSAALTVTNTASAEIKHSTITTKVKNAPALNIGVGGGSIRIDNSLIETQGQASPIIYDRGNVNFANTTGTANGSRAAVVENDSVLTINNSTFLVSGAGEEDSSEAAFLVKGTGKSTITINNSSINLNKNLPYYNLAPVFLINNTTTELNFYGTIFNFGSAIFISATSSNITINLNNNVISGALNLDENSSLNMYLTNNSSYTGSINNDKANIKLSKDSELNLTGDTYIASLENEDSENNNIITNGYHLYLNGNLLK
jgi:hypothetical protein